MTVATHTSNHSSLFWD